MFAGELPPQSESGSLRFDRFSHFLAALSPASREQLGPCVWPESESVALVPIEYGSEVIGLLHVADPRPNAISAEMVESLERLPLELAHGDPPGSHRGSAAAGT